MSEPIVIPPAAYWKLRCRALLFESVRVSAQAQLDKAKAELDAAGVEAGLTPGVNYTLDDATCAAVLVTALRAVNESAAS